MGIVLAWLGKSCFYISFSVNNP